MSYLIPDRCEVLWVCQSDQSLAIIMPAAGSESVDINHPVATEIQL
jgi:hypothetical protein